MCGIATLTMLVSRISRIDASVTVTAMIQRLAYDGSSGRVASRMPAADDTEARRLLGHHGHAHAHARPQRVRRVLTAVDADADRDPLHDLGEIAGGVVGRQQREARAGG